MPVYLLHGFRWPRPLIRIHIILRNLEDAAAEWLVAPGTTKTLLQNFHEDFPEPMNHLPDLRFIEQYDPDDVSEEAVNSQPYAYVADMVHVVKLGVDVEEIRGRGVSNDQWGSMLELRDKIAPDAPVGWFVVICGDEERSAPSETDSPPRAQQRTAYTLPHHGRSEAGSNGSRNGYQPSAYSPDDHRRPQTARTQKYGQDEYAQTGYNDNAYTQNGSPNSGRVQNGYTHQNGRTQNGYVQNGHAQNGYAQNGHAQNGYAQNGHAQNGQVPDPYISPRNGVAPNTFSMKSMSPETPQKGGLRGWLRKTKSRTNIRELRNSDSSGVSRSPPPPVPKLQY